MSNNEKKCKEAKAKAQEANLGLHIQEVCTGKLFRLTENPLLRKK